MTTYVVMLRGIVWGEFPTREEAETVAKRLQLSGLQARVETRAVEVNNNESII